MNVLAFSLSDIDFAKIVETYVFPWATKLVFALVILLVGLWLSRWIVKIAKGGLERSRMDTMLINFIGSILRWVLVLVVVIAAVDTLGVDTTSFVAVLGAAGLAVGLALKDSLQNFASGVMLILFRPFTVGDFVEAGGAEGVVEEIKIFSTQLRTPDNRQVIVPNGDIFNGTITNNNAKPTRRIDLVVGIGYDDDIRQAKEILLSIINEEERILAEPEPFLAVGELGDSSVNFLVRPWVNAADYFPTKCDLLEKIKLTFDEKGISIPFPQMDIHLDGELEKKSA